MKRASYMLAGAICAERGLVNVYETDKDGNKTLVKKGLEITTPEAETHEELLSLMEDGKESFADKLAQGQLDIIRQRKIREAAEDAVTAAILNGETVEMDTATSAGAEGEKVDFGAHSEDERKEVVRERCQAIGDAYVYGSRPAATGAGKVVKEKAAKQDTLAAAIARGELTDEEVAKLKAIGAI